MRCLQSFFTEAQGWTPGVSRAPDPAVRLVLVFGAPAMLRNGDRLADIARSYPEAVIAGCSTAGEILGTEVLDDSLVVTAVELEHTEVRSATVPMASAQESRAVGENLARQLTADDLAHLLVFSDGIHVNGSELVEGLRGPLHERARVTGGLAGDGERFQETLIVADSAAAPDRVTAVGFYGDRLRTGHGSLGGWDPFGPERLVTRAEGNVLHELDGRLALDVYRRYLGPYAKDLPASALLFPLALRPVEGEPAVVRTVLSVDDEKGTMTFAGDMPEGSYARFMKASFDRLIVGATDAAKQSYESLGSTSPDFALLISCVGRKMVLKQRVEEEVEGVRRALGDRPALAGFYSYGEISPFSAPDTCCRLHNQTMTITSFHEE